MAGMTQKSLVYLLFDFISIAVSFFYIYIYILQLLCFLYILLILFLVCIYVFVFAVECFEKVVFNFMLKEVYILQMF